MARQQCLCFIYFLVVFVTGACSTAVPCEVRDDESNLVTGVFQKEGVYYFSIPTSDCSWSIVLANPYYDDSNVRLRILDNIVYTLLIEVLDWEGKVLGMVSMTYGDSNFSESFQSPYYLNISMIGSGSFRAQIEHFSVPGIPVNSSATRLTALSDARYLRSFGYPVGYPNSLHFTYIISAGDGRHVKVSMDDLQLADAYAECDSRTGDYVEVRDLYLPFATLCWCQGFQTTVSSGPEIILIFHTNSRGSQKGFELRYWTTSESQAVTSPAASMCFTVIEAQDESSDLTLPIYQDSSAFSNECRWIISAGAESSFKIMVQVNDVDLSDGTELKLYNGSSADDDNMLGQTDVGSLRRVYHTLGNTLLVVFRTLSTTLYPRRFQLSFKRVGSLAIGCNNTIIVDEAVVLTSFGIQEEYFPSLTCRYVLQAPFGFLVSLVSANVRFPPSRGTGCRTWLRYRTADADVSQELCTSEDVLNDFPISRVVWFEASTSLYQAKFSFLLEAQRNSEAVPTDGVLTQGPEQVEQSTKEPAEIRHQTYETVSEQSYLAPPSYTQGPRHDVYVWTCGINTVDYSKRIQLSSNIDYWGLTETCDFVDVYDGASQSGTLLAHWCGTEYLAVKSKYLHLFLEFRAHFGSRGPFVIEATLVPADSNHYPGTPADVNIPEAVGISVGIGVFVILWIVLGVCIKRARRRQQLRELRANIGRMIVLHVETTGSMAASEDIERLLAADPDHETSATPWWRSFLTRQEADHLDNDEAPPPYPGLPDATPQENNPREPPPPYTLSDHNISVPTSDRLFLERPQGTNGGDFSLRAEDSMPAEPDDVPCLLESAHWEDGENREELICLEDERSDVV